MNDSSLYGYYEYLADFNQQIESVRLFLEKEDVVRRIWSKDYTVWKETSCEIVNRLGWLDSPVKMREKVSEIKLFVQEVVERGIKDVLILGMGGSSLCCEVIRNVFANVSTYPTLHVLDTIHPFNIAVVREKIRPLETLVIVSTKSGTTVETISLMRYFYREFVKELGDGRASKHFVGITDPGTDLERVASERKFCRLFLNNPDIGGRFSALSFFGLVPAALYGVDISGLLDTAGRARELCKVPRILSKHDSYNVAASFGAAIGKLAEIGANKMVVVTSERFRSFNLWLEQLVAESTGKEGKSILPVFERVDFVHKRGGNDRFFVFIKEMTDSRFDEQIEQLKKRNLPIFVIEYKDSHDLGGLFFFWEFAVSVAASVMKVNPFNQPDVEASKAKTKKILKSYVYEGNVQSPPIVFRVGDITFYADLDLKDVDSFKNWLEVASKDSNHGYICVQSFLPIKEEISQLLEKLKIRLWDLYGLVVTWGYGPRYLHSTGQLHKGDCGEGIFLQLISEIKSDIDIPDSLDEDGSSLSFGVLMRSQAFGDYETLVDKGRKVVGVSLSGYVEESIREVMRIF